MGSLTNILTKGLFILIATALEALGAFAVLATLVAYVVLVLMDGDKP